MKKNNKGFTLIELLAVIVILGLLMAIAIPSVTRYITQSRKKTLITTMGNYTGALVNEVNSFEYTFTSSNTVYAVPIECIAVERGGNSPFGEWYQANNSYFAYVLVQYDEDSSSYRYAFTFKDSAGYGMYPTAQSSLSGNDKNIKTGLSLSKPQNGKVTTLTSFDNWADSGFKLTSDTEIKVLVAESQGKIGDGLNTCTLQQKGSNYAQVEDEKEQNNVDEPEEEILVGDAYALVLDNSANPNDNLPMIFVRSETPIKAGDTYNSDTYGNIKVKDAYTGFEDNTYTFTYETVANDITHVLNTPWAAYSLDITSVITEDKVRFKSMDYLFYGFSMLTHANLDKIDTSQITSFKSTFSSTNVEYVVLNGKARYGGPAIHTPIAPLHIEGLGTWNTSKVTDMSSMFEYSGVVLLDGISSWDVSKVTNMSKMFSSDNGTNSSLMISEEKFLDLDLSGWNTINVNDMSSMFEYSTFNEFNISNWNTSNVVNMNSMFNQTEFNQNQIINLSSWNVGKVTDWKNFNSGCESIIVKPSKFQ